MPLSESVREEVAARFRARYLEDQAGHHEHDLAHYVEGAPVEHQEIIAAEYLALRNGATASTCVGEAPRGVAPDPGAIGPYKIVRELGRGGQATVFLADDPRLHRQVAVKVLDPGPSIDHRVLERFRREAAITSRLEHSNICTVFEAGEDHGSLWIAMRFVDGESLAKKISTARSGKTMDGTEILAFTGGDGLPEPAREESAQSTGPKTWAEIQHTLVLFEKIAVALHAAHEHGVIHRDVKPGNILVAKDGEPVLVDFGLAQDIEAREPTLTVTGDLMGTPHYMSPEQLAAQRIRLDRRTDVYSLGVTLFECLTLHRPFDSPTREGLYRAIMTKPPPDPRGLNPQLPRDLRVVIETALDKDCDRRYQTALDFAEDLARVRQLQPIRARPPSIELRIRRWAQRNPALAISILSGVLIGLVAILMYVRSQRIARETEERFTLLLSVPLLAEVADATPTLDPVLTDLLARAESLAASLPAEDAIMRALSRDGAPSSLSSRLGSRALDRAFATLRGLRDPDPKVGTIARLRSRVDAARRAQQSLDENAALWAATIAEISDRVRSPQYAGLRITPQLGLLPLGPDPRSHLQEFACVISGDPPKRTPAGDLVLPIESAIVLVLIPGGTFTMGARKPADEEERAGTANVDFDAVIKEEPLHAVTLDPFFISKYEMTQGQWVHVTGLNPSLYRFSDPEADAMRLTPLNPVETVSYGAATNQLRILGFSLPTEAQWEYAARARTTTPWWTGAAAASLAGSADHGLAANLADEAQARAQGRAASAAEWVGVDDGFIGHAPVGSFRPNPFGLHDVHGNVWEWCQDVHWKYENPVRARDGLRDVWAQPFPMTSVGLINYVLRGGAFNKGPVEARSSSRSFGSEKYASQYVGVRPARAIER